MLKPAIFVNSAGVDASGALVPTCSWTRGVRRSRHRCRRRFNSHVARGEVAGKIGNVTSVHQEIPRSRAAAHDASTGCSHKLRRTLALELASLHSVVGRLAPGWY